MDDDEFGAAGGMSGWRKQRARRKPSPVAFRPPQIPLDLTRARTRSLRLTAFECLPLRGVALAATVQYRLHTTVLHCGFASDSAGIAGPSFVCLPANSCVCIPDE
jgi:hypothetical protein